MFSFASKMLNTLMGEGEGGAPVGGIPGSGPPGGLPQPRAQVQMRPPYHQPGPRLQQMSYPRITSHPSPQPVLRGGPEEPNLDLSHLSAEERALIQQVMAKAKDLDTTQTPLKPDNQFHNANSKEEEIRQNTFNMPSGNYGPPQNMSFHQDNFPQSQNIHKPQETFHQGNNMFQNNPEHFSHHKENIPYSSDNFQKPSDTFQDNLSSTLTQRFDNFQMKQEVQSLQDNFSLNQRKEFSLQRQDSYNSAKQSTSYFNSSCWEKNEKDEVPRPGNSQQPDCEYSTPSPVSNSPEIRLSPSSPPASPSSEDSRTSLLATSKDEMKPHLPMESFYDHSPGEVYTIPEEEDEISSPTSDGVTSLRKRRLVGAQNIHKENGSSGSASLQSNHFRSNNFNLLNQNTLKTNTSFGQIGGESEKSNGNNVSNLDSYSNSLRQNDFMSENKRTNDLGETQYQSQFLEKHPERNGQPTSNLIQHHTPTDSLANKHELMEKHFQSTTSIRPQHSDHQMQHHILQGSPQQSSQQLQLHQQQQQQQQQQRQLQQQHINQQQTHLHQQQPQQTSPLIHHPQQQQQQQQQQLQQQQQQLQQQQQQQQQPSQQQQHLPQHQQQQNAHQQQHLNHHLQQQQQPQTQQLTQQHHLQQQQQLQGQQSTVQPHQPQQNMSFNVQQVTQIQQQPLNPNNQQLSHNAQQIQLQNPLEKKASQLSEQQLQQQNQIQIQQQSSLQQQLHRQQQQELQYLQMKKLQHFQRQQLHSRVNSRSPMLQQNKQNMDSNFQIMKSEAGFYEHEDSWRGYNEFPDEITLQQLYCKDFDFEHQLNQQKSRQQERALGYQNDMDVDSFNLHKQNSQQNNSQAKSSAGTISGMLADFSRALGLSNTSDEKSQEEHSPHSTDNKDSNQQQSQKSISQQQIQAQIRANEQFIHGQQQTPLSVDYQSSQHSHMTLDSKQIRNQNETKLQSNTTNTFQNPQFQISQPVDYNQLQSNQQIQVFNQQNLIQQQKQQSVLKDDFLNSLDSDQKAMYIQQQLYQKLPEHQPMFAQNLTPQQQQMYQHHMQLQHHAQHLKKIKRSLPQSALDQQRPGQIQKKENNLNMMNQGLGSGVTIQQMMAAQFLGQQPIHPMQLMNSQIVGSEMKITNQSRIVSGSNPVLVASGLTSQQLNSATPMGTPQSTPVGTPRGTRDGGDSSDTMSETDSQKSLRTRRKLPSIPSDQEAITLPNNKKRDGRVKTKSPHDKFSRSYSPLRFSEGGYRISSSNLMLQRPSSSETNLRKVSNFGPETIPRPGSALGLLQGSSVVSSSGMHVDYNRDSELASCLPPDLRYLLHSYKSSDPYSKQQFIQAYKDHLSGEVKLSDRRALNRLTNIDWETERLLSRNKDLLRNPKSRLDIQRKIAYSGIGRTRKLRTHRRQLSDPKIHLEMSPLKDGSEASYNRGYYGVTHPSLRPPYKSYEYESIDDGKLSDWDSSHPYLASYAIAGGALRETAINSVLDKEHMSTDPMRYDVRRYSDSLDLRRRDVGKHHSKPRSWQPSPYGSDEEEDQLSREQKKAKIKAEIARRRQQIEENARLHEELLRLARLRESAELGYAPLGNTPTLTGDYAMSSVLKSIDDLIGREAEYTSHRTPEDRSMDRIASTFRTDDYTCGVYERLTDFSPITDFSTPHAMPLLPDMPTRSRKLLEDLGSSPITESVLTLPQKAKALL